MKNNEIQELVNKAQKGDPKSFENIYNHFHKQILYYVYSRVNSIHIAQDIVSEVFLSLVEGIKKFKGTSTFKNYLFGITKNKLRDYIKSKYKSDSYVLESNISDNIFELIPDLTEEESEENSIYKNKIRSTLSKIIDKMKPRYAKVLNLRFNEMYSIEEVAEEMGLTANNVKVIQHRAIKQAHSIWNSMEDEEKNNYLTVY